jgi:hypothetical protein
VNDKSHLIPRLNINAVRAANERFHAGDRRPNMKDGTRRSIRLHIPGEPKRWAKGMPAGTVGPLRPRLTARLLRLAAASAESSKTGQSRP